ncbi:MAG: thiol reductant ABC exporter subunit CydC [Anaerovibrio sp.]|uniref:thiol reductant ABC exporter subunit CydC n=1 Tax=Anaerovibrio sp. TaxID=1872532 RepID=UPI0025FA7DB1|nr:thiol reductant ABC exporter subunit CydC [Anaerovibrio sp.]MCR5175517.1 thiol reductant ABC exporter subunit CydC [Anaerovibrio sp.]
MNKFSILKKLIVIEGPVRVFLMVCTGVISGVTGIGLMGAAAWIISYAALQPPLYALTLGITCVRFFGLSRAAGRYLMRLYSHGVAFRCYEKIQLMVYRTVCRTLPLKTVLVRQGQYLKQLSTDAETLRDFYLRWLLPVMSTGLLTLCLMTWLYSISPFAACLVGFLWGIHVILPAVMVSAPNADNEGGVYRDVLLEGTSGRDELLLSGHIDKFMNRLHDEACQYGVSQEKQQLSQDISVTVLDIIRQVVFVIYLVLLVQAVGMGVLEPRWLAVWLLLLLGLYGEFAELSMAAVQFHGACKAAEHVLVDKEHSSSLPETALEIDHQQPFLQAREISFAYVPGLPVFAPLSFELQQGDALAVRGDSGCGKTTLAQLLLRFWPVDSGELLLWGQPYDKWPVEKLRSCFSGALQPCHIFSDSVRDNFTRLHPEITDECIWQALDTAQLGHIVRQFPHKLDEVMGDNGRRLSGGQRSRLLTALALVSEAPCLILDEPTDGLDAATGSQLIDAILAHVNNTGKTLIVITHDEEVAAKLPARIWLQ